jgi:hypothetical protein
VEQEIIWAQLQWPHHCYQGYYRETHEEN